MAPPGRGGGDEGLGKAYPRSTLAMGLCETVVTYLLTGRPRSPHHYGSLIEVVGDPLRAVVHGLVERRPAPSLLAQHAAQRLAVRLAVSPCE